MIDIQFIRDNPELVAEKSKQKGYEVDVQKILKLDEERRELLQQIESNRNVRNQIAKMGLRPDGSHPQMTEGKRLKTEGEALEDKFRPVNEEFRKILAEVPNITPDDTPLGGEENNREEKKWGDTADKGFEVKDIWLGRPNAGCCSPVSGTSARSIRRRCCSPG